jgi:transcriptional regulator with XRE-family HTH domain
MANEIRVFLAKQVIARRKKVKLSQAALSRQTGLSIARISEIERAKANPTLDTLEALADALNVSLVDLLDYEGSLTSTDAIKGKIADNLGKFDAKQLRTVLALVRSIRK